MRNAMRESGVTSDLGQLEEFALDQLADAQLAATRTAFARLDNEMRRVLSLVFESDVRGQESLQTVCAEMGLSESDARAQIRRARRELLKNYRRSWGSSNERGSEHDISDDLAMAMLMDATMSQPRTPDVDFERIELLAREKLKDIEDARNTAAGRGKRGARFLWGQALAAAAAVAALVFVLWVGRDPASLARSIYMSLPLESSPEDNLGGSRQESELLFFATHGAFSISKPQDLHVEVSAVDTESVWSREDYAWHRETFNVTNRALARRPMRFKGELFNPDQLVVASDSYPMGTHLEFREPASQQIARAQVKDSTSRGTSISQGLVRRLNLDPGKRRFDLEVRVVATDGGTVTALPRPVRRQDQS